MPQVRACVRFLQKRKQNRGVLFHWPRTKQKLNKRLQSVHARSCRPSFVPALVKCVHVCAQHARHFTTRTTAIFGHRGKGGFVLSLLFGFGGGETGGLCVCGSTFFGVARNHYRGSRSCFGRDSGRYHSPRSLSCYVFFRILK